ncbi:MAG: ABC transporter substrate-binding protein [Gemmatimonadales bacterium]
MLEEPGPWGTGPFVLKEGVSTLKKRSPQVVMEPNPTYWDADRKPSVRVVFDNVISKAEAIDFLADSAGKVDLVTELTVAEAAKVSASKNAHVVRSDAKTVLAGVFNRTKKDSRWNDVRLRRAVNTAVDRKAIVKNGAAGYGTVLPAMIVPGAFGSDDGLEPYPFDPAAAKKLAGAGAAKAVTIVAGEGYKAVVEAMTANLQEAGFTVRPVYAATPEGDDWDIWLVEHFDWSPEWPAGVVYREFFGEDGGFRKTAAVDPGFKQRYAKLLSTSDVKAQETLVRDLDKYVHDQADLLFLYAPSKLFGVSNRIKFVPYKTTMLELAETTVGQPVASR